MSTFDEARWLAEQDALQMAEPTYVVGLSGPPRSGKDSIGAVLVQLLMEKHPILACQRALSMPMRKTIYAMIGKDYTLEHYETSKDKPRPELGGISIRQAMIKLSEEWVKPTYGHGFWAASMLNTLPMDRARVVVITDMGFPSEVEVLEQAFGAEHCVWGNIVRPGCTFEGDSRSHVGCEERRTVIINEGESIDQVNTAAARLYGRLLNQFHWDLPTRG